MNLKIVAFLALLALSASSSALNLTINASEMFNRNFVLDDYDYVFIQDLNASVTSVSHQAVGNFTYYLNSSSNVSCIENFSNLTAFLGNYSIVYFVNNSQKLNSQINLSFGQTWSNDNLNFSLSCPAFPKINDVKILNAGEKYANTDFNLVVMASGNSGATCVSTAISEALCRKSYGLISSSECDIPVLKSKNLNQSGSSNGSTTTTILSQSQSQANGDIDWTFVILAVAAVGVGAFILKKKNDSKVGEENGF